jgi:hypothetical protein
MIGASVSGKRFEIRNTLDLQSRDIFLLGLADVSYKMWAG